MLGPDTILLLPDQANGPEWEECIRSAREDWPSIEPHQGFPPPLALRYVRVSKAVVFAPGSLQALLRALDQGVACAVPVSNRGNADEEIAGLFPDTGLADHPNNRFAIASHLSSTQTGKLRSIPASSRHCVASRSPSYALQEACTAVLDSFVYVPISTSPSIAPCEDSMLLGTSPSQNQPGLCVWISSDNPDPALTLANMAQLPGMEILLLNTTGQVLPGTGSNDIWTVPADASWNSLAPKLKRWFGDRNVVLVRAGLFILPAPFARMAECPPCTGAVEDMQSGIRQAPAFSAWNPDAPLSSQPFQWIVANPARPVPTNLPANNELFALGKSAQARESGSLPESVRTHLLGFDCLRVSAKGQTVDLAGNPAQQSGCDALLWKLEPSDLPGLAIRLRKLRLAGCRRLLINFENSFFQSPDAPFAHPGCSPMDVRREILQAGFAISKTDFWPGCQNVVHQDQYFATETKSQGWTAEEKLWATHSRLWMAADSCSHAHSTERKVSVVLLALNKVDYTRKCIDSLRANCRQNLELILVNNGSTDGTRAYFDSIPGAKVIHNTTNMGVAAGWNQGMRLATGDYILILNNDTLVAPHTVENLVRCAVNHPDAGLVSPRSNQIAGPQKVEGFSYNNEFQITNKAELIQNENDLSCWEFSPLKGFCMLIPREVQQKIGEFDERFGIGNFEDDDYSVRVLYHGYRLLVADDSFLFHYGSVSFDQANIDWTAQMEKNHALFDTKWEQGRGAAWLQPEKSEPALADESTYRKALALNELDPDAYYGLGRLQLRRGEIQQAFANFCKSMECDPTRSEIAAATVQLLKSNYTDEQSADVLQFLRRRFPFAKAFQSSEIQPAKTIEPSVHAYNEAGIDLFGQGRFTEAQDLFARALSFGDDPDTLLNYYDCCLRTGKMDSVASRLEAACKKSPDNSELKAAWQELQGLGNVLHLTGDKIIYWRECNIAAEKYLQEGLKDKCREALQLALNEQPANYRALNTLGLLYWYAGDLKSAFDSFSSSLRSNPYFSDAMVNLFDCAALSDRLSEIRGPLQQALAMMPENRDFKEIQRHLDAGTLPERLSIYTEHTQSNERLQERLDKGNLLLKEGDINAATLLFTDILAQHPDNVEALNGVGIAAFLRGCLDDARMLFSHALKIKPLDQDTLLNYWETTKDTPRKSEAFAILQNALAMDPTLDSVASIVRTGGNS